MRVIRSYFVFCRLIEFILGPLVLMLIQKHHSPENIRPGPFLSVAIINALSNNLQSCIRVSILIEVARQIIGMSVVQDIRNGHVQKLVEVSQTALHSWYGRRCRIEPYVQRQLICWADEFPRDTSRMVAPGLGYIVNERFQRHVSFWNLNVQ